MTTDVAVGRPTADTAAAAPRRTVTTASIRSVVDSYVKYRSSLSRRRISNDSRRSDNVVGEDQVDGLMSESDVDNRVSSANLPPGLEQALRVLSREFEQRYEQASWHESAEQFDSILIR